MDQIPYSEGLRHCYTDSEAASDADASDEQLLRILTLTLIWSKSFLCPLWGAYRDCFHVFSFSLRSLPVSHVEGSSLTTSLRYQDLRSFFVIS